MALCEKSQLLRDLINECRGYRVLDDDDVLKRGDETVCTSTLLAEAEEWGECKESDFGSDFGKSVSQLNGDASEDMDADERLFRRKVPEPVGHDPYAFTTAGLSLAATASAADRITELHGRKVQLEKLALELLHDLEEESSTVCDEESSCCDSTRCALIRRARKLLGISRGRTS